MRTLRYGVFQMEDGWRLWCGTQPLARFDSGPDAIAAGKRAAREAMGSGCDVELHIMDVAGVLRQAPPASFGH